MDVPEIVQEWQNQARVETTRRLLRNLLEQRFGPMPEDLQRRIEEMNDPAGLEAAILTISRVQRLDDLQL